MTQIEPSLCSGRKEEPMGKPHQKAETCGQRGHVCHTYPRDLINHHPIIMRVALPSHRARFYRSQGQDHLSLRCHTVGHDSVHTILSTNLYKDSIFSITEYAGSKKAGWFNHICGTSEIRLFLTPNMASNWSACTLEERLGNSQLLLLSFSECQLIQDHSIAFISPEWCQPAFKILCLIKWKGF